MLFDDLQSANNCLQSANNWFEMSEPILCIAAAHCCCAQVLLTSTLQNLVLKLVQVTECKCKSATLSQSVSSSLSSLDSGSNVTIR